MKEGSIKVMAVKIAKGMWPGNSAIAQNADLIEAALTAIWDEAIEAARRIEVASVDQIEAGISDPPDWLARQGRASGFNKGVKAKQCAIRRLRKGKP